MSKVSIIVPMYGVENYINECLESVASQTFKDIECIVIDDCSPDRSYDIARNFIDNYDGEIEFKMVRHPINKGLSGARNTGIDYSTGDYIFFLDSDDLITPSAIEDLFTNIGDADLIMGNNLMFLDDTGEIIRPPKTILKDYYYFDDLYDYMTNPDIMNLNYYGVPWNKLFNKKFIDAHKLRFDEGIYFEDDVWSFYVYANGPRVAIISEMTYKYRIRSESIMNSYGEKHLLSSIMIPHFVLRYICQNMFKETWYIEQSIERFIMAALSACLYRSSDSSLYYKIYSHFLHVHKPSISFWLNPKINKTTKIRALHYYLPVIGCFYIKMILLWQKKKMCRITRVPKIKLSEQFWDKLDSILKDSSYLSCLEKR